MVLGVHGNSGCINVILKPDKNIHPKRTQALLESNLPAIG